MHSHGISWEGDLLDLAIEEKLVDKSGAWFSYGSERIGQGRENAKQWLREHPEAAARIRNTILTKRGLLTAPVEENGETEAPAAAPEPAKARR